MSDWNVNSMKPTARAVKDQEMAIRRAYDLNTGLLAVLAQFKTIEYIKANHKWAILSSKKLRDLFPSTSIEWRSQEAWEWTVSHWYSGALKRSVQASMHNITDTNKKNIKTKVSELHG